MKSQEEIYLRLHAQLIRCDPLELSSLVKHSLEKDIKTLESRFLAEGLSFLTKTLPKLGKALDLGLVCSRFTLPRGFKSAGKPNRPAFMQAYFSLVFDEDGSLLDDASVGAVRHLRQVLYFAYKLEMPYSTADNSRVIESFVATDKSLELADTPLANDIMSLAKIITQKVFHGFDHKDIHPRHGPGAVATGEKLETKWRFSRLYNAIHQVYPYYNYYVVGGARELADRLDWYRSLQRLESGVAKVVLVPKDSRGPRLISCEPLEYQWIQQGLGRKLAAFLEYGNPYTKGVVNFTRQDINGTLAKASSASQQHATLDLRDASDRVSLGVVRSVFTRTAGLLRALEACRSTATKLPDGRVVTLNKFAPMGSALCFPVESYIFWVTIVAAVILRKNLPLHVVAKQVYVYGDDIVVPTDWALLSIQALEAIGLLVNVDKSCFTGYFRESCGIDAFKGEIVTPIRLKKPWSYQTNDGSVLYSYASIANKMDQSGYKGVSELVWNELERLYGKIPYGTPLSSFPCKLVDSPMKAMILNKSFLRSRSNRHYQQLEFSVYFLTTRRTRSILDSWPRLLRDVITPPFGDPSFVVLPLSTKLKRGWASVA